MRLIPTLLLLAALPAAAQKPCDCIDKGDLKERLKRSTAAIQAYGKELATVGAQPYSAAGRDALQGRVNDAMFGAKTKGRIPLNAHGTTSNNCDIVVNAPTKCLEAVIRAHEQVHQDACKRDYETTAPKILMGKAKDRFDALNTTMAFYIMEEVAGYQAELAFIQRELARLERDCQPNPPGPKRHYSPTRGIDVSGGSQPSSGSDPGKPKGYAPPPMPKPKPLPVPPPIK